MSGRSVSLRRRVGSAAVQDEDGLVAAAEELFQAAVVEFLVAEEPQVCWLAAEVSKSAAEVVEGSAGESVAALRTAEVGLGPELALSAVLVAEVVGTGTAEA